MITLANDFRQSAVKVAPGVAPHGQLSKNPILDEALIGQIATGDRDAFRLLFARHNARIFRFLLRIVRHEAVAENLVNEVFIHVWNHADRFESRSRARTWILGIARRKAILSLRRRSFEELDDKIRPQDPGDDPGAAMPNVTRSELLQEVLKKLSRPHREVIDLVYYHEQSIDEVAKIVGASQNTVKTRLFCARKHIAELVSNRGVDATCLR